jgi:membrane-associated phospholipid phosphatase
VIDLRRADTTNESPFSVTRTARSRRNVTALAVGVAAFAATTTLARRPITPSEVRAFRVANDLPDEAYPFIWTPMQYGTFATVPFAATVALARHRPRLALTIGAGGTAAWLLAKAAKRIVDRGRPATILDDVSLRGAEEGDRGFPSGHAAVSSAITVAALPYAAGETKIALLALCGFVPFARIYVGAHLPLDVIGGAALGLAIGAVADLLVRRELQVEHLDLPGSCSG